jgi:hypothetical protein
MAGFQWEGLVEFGLKWVAQFAGIVIQKGADAYGISNCQTHPVPAIPATD